MGFSSISSAIKTMSVLKKHVKGSKVRSVIGLENIFLQLLVISQQQQMELEPLLPMNCVPCLHHSLMNMVASANVASQSWSNVLGWLRHCQHLQILSQ